jgi:dUTP pyrophosphatase
VPSEKVTIKVKSLSPDAIIPTKGTEFAACYDLYANESVSIASGKVTPVKCGIAVELPDGYFLDIRPRSGLSKIVGIANAPGTIDSDYRGEVIILLYLHNTLDSNFHKIVKGERIAQFRVEKVWDTELVVSDKLSDTKRGEKGFGSTGK